MQLESGSDDQGFTLIEVVVSFTLLVIIATAAVVALSSGAKATGASQQKTQANNIARQYLEAARAQGAFGVSDTSPLTVSTTGIPSLKVCRVYTPASSTLSSAASWDPAGSCPTPSSGSACTPGGSSDNSFYITVLVGWKTNFGTSTASGYRTLRTDTLLACKS